MNSDKDPFVDFLRSRKGCTIYLKPYSGNAGDQLIWMGSKILLNELGLKRILNPQKADIILWPGGNPTMWRRNLTGWLDCWKRWPHAEFVVGPAEFKGNDEPWQMMLTTTRAKVGALFARDPESYQNLRNLNMPKSVQVGLGNDAAFHLKDTKWIADIRETCLSEYILASFREDHESVMLRQKHNRLHEIWPFSSISWRFKHHQKKRFHFKRLGMVKKTAQSSLPLIVEDVSMMSFYSFVEYVSRADQVHTDRLHCMIMALLLGKEVFAYPTRYDKLEGVYEHSIKAWATVNFVDALGDFIPR